MREKLVWFVALGLAVGATTTALAEGAVKVLRCSVARVCDSAGRCEAGSGQLEFRMEPRSVEASRAGHYALHYAGEIAAMEALSDAGPFLWSIGTQRHALLASSEREWLWHELSLEPAPKAVIRFLVCSFDG